MTIEAIDIEARAKEARRWFETGSNCAQSVAMAYADCMGMELGQIERLTLALGGGLGRQREVCGAVSAGSIVLGAMEAAAAGADHKARAYAAVQDLSGRFREQNGSIVCRELLALGKGENSDPQPTPRTEHYYRRRPCAHYVESSARIVGEMITRMLGEKH